MKRQSLSVKITCLVLMAAMIVSMLAGCGKDSDVASDFASKMADATGQNNAGKDENNKDADSTDKTDAASETDGPVRVDEEVDEKWIEV
ncbi:MAG: hypothetical protein J5574_04040, partial [Lachnospiraceae bacterium]|nr:hypothetical protein [Lachnospiraceae bacterium]